MLFYSVSCANFLFYPSELANIEYPLTENNGSRPETKECPEKKKNIESGNNLETGKGNEKLFVFMRTRGRLGNLLFQYAATIAIVNYTKRKALFGKKMLYLTNIFPKLTVNVIERVPRWRKVKEKAVWDFDENLFHLPNENIKIEGYVSSFRYFERMLPWFYTDLLAHFNNTLSTKADHFIQDVKKQYKVKSNGVLPKTVCVHVRRGDKATQFAHDVLSFRLPSAEEILSAMKYMESKHEHVAFIVASDTTDWCKQHLQKHNVYISNLTTFYEDFVLVSSCVDMIMTVGTFGWWAAWLTSQRGGTSMYFKFPFVEGTTKDALLNRHNSFPEEWIAYP